MTAHVLLGVVALLHVAFFAMESLWWTTPAVRQRMGQTVEQAQATRVLAQNQGVYNLFLAAGCLWAIVCPDAGMGRQLGLFFTGCVIVAAIVGGATASRRILVVQGLPAVLAMVALQIAP